MKITSSGVSVYEVILNLNHWEGMLSSDLPAFNQDLMDFMPSTSTHKCMSGEHGGFHKELNKGTNFSHVVEHVLLELIHLAHPTQPEFSGWTKNLGDGHYVIHYGAPDFLTGRLAAILAVEIVSKLQRGESPTLDDYLDRVRHPMDYFSDERSRQLDLRENQDTDIVALASDPVPVLSQQQCDHLSQVFREVEDHFPTVQKRWTSAFEAFGGDFASGIRDKIELVNPDRTLSCLITGDFKSYFQSVTNLSRMMRAIRIPLTFVTHSAWLYKNILQVVILENHNENMTDRKHTITDFDNFYQNIFHSIIAGYAKPEEQIDDHENLKLCAFRARQVRKNGVLIVDDDIMARKVVRTMLEYSGFITYGASSGVDALNLLADSSIRVGVAVLDLNLTGMSGQAVCQRIRESYPKIRIILSSTFPLPENHKCSLDAHNVSFLQKPFETATLINLVRELMDLKAVSPN